MGDDERRSVDDKLDAILARLGGIETRVGGLETSFGGLETRMTDIENAFATLKGELRADIWRSSFTIIAVYGGAIGLALALARIYRAA
jgi:hypothetical protein